MRKDETDARTELTAGALTPWFGEGELVHSHDLPALIGYLSFGLLIFQRLLRPVFRAVVAAISKKLADRLNNCIDLTVNVVEALGRRVGGLLRTFLWPAITHAEQRPVVTVALKMAQAHLARRGVRDKLLEDLAENDDEEVAPKVTLVLVARILVRRLWTELQYLASLDPTYRLGLAVLILAFPAISFGAAELTVGVPWPQSAAHMLIGVGLGVTGLTLADPARTPRQLWVGLCLLAGGFVAIFVLTSTLGGQEALWANILLKLSVATGVVACRYIASGQNLRPVRTALILWAAINVGGLVQGGPTILVLLHSVIVWLVIATWRAAASDDGAYARLRAITRMPRTTSPRPKRRRRKAELRTPSIPPAEGGSDSTRAESGGDGHDT